jgi:hypothetical protein
MGIVVFIAPAMPNSAVKMACAAHSAMCRVLLQSFVASKAQLGFSFNSRVGNSHQQEGSVAARQKHRQADCIKKQLQLNARKAALQRGAESKASRGRKKTKPTSQRDRMKVFGSPYFPRIFPRLS